MRIKTDLDTKMLARILDKQMHDALRHLVEKEFKPEVIVDIGAGSGFWSKGAGIFFKEAEIFMIDPLIENEEKLNLMCETDPRYHYILTAVGSEPGYRTMNVTPDHDGSSLLNYYAGEDTSWQRRVPVATLDQLLSEGRIKSPNLVKIDVQGFEMRVLQGGQKVFDTAEVFIIEINLFEFMPECPRAHEVIAFMADRGFFLFDVAGSLRRPLENDLAQLDLVLVSAKSPMVGSNKWMRYIRGPLVSVILCTYNPRMDILEWTLDSLEKQTLPKSEFELIIVDNNSIPALDEKKLRHGRSLSLHIIREPRQGLTFSRCAGIAEAKSNLLVFVDDDNHLDADYLENAVRITEKAPKIGLYGGISEGVFEKPVPGWKEKLLPYLGVRDYGPEPIISYEDCWGEWEPIGAGMVSRRDVADEFVQVIKTTPIAGALGRKGSALLSGEDSLFARVANRLGYSCSYQPSVKLSHFMKESRLKYHHLSRTLEGHGRSFVILQTVTGKTTEALGFFRVCYILSRRLFGRVRRLGLRAGVIQWFWDYGFVQESRRKKER